MAIDTRQKRESSMHVLSPWRMRLPVPDGAVSQADRQHTAFRYSGLLAVGVVAGPYCVGAGEIYIVGLGVGGVYVPGLAPGQAYMPGTGPGDVCA